MADTEKKVSEDEEKKPDEPEPAVSETILAPYTPAGELERAETILKDYAHRALAQLEERIENGITQFVDWAESQSTAYDDLPTLLAAGQGLAQFIGTLSPKGSPIHRAISGRLAALEGKLPWYQGITATDYGTGLQLAVHEMIEHIDGNLTQILADDWEDLQRLTRSQPTAFISELTRLGLPRTNFDPELVMKAMLGQMTQQRQTAADAQKIATDQMLTQQQLIEQSTNKTLKI